MSGTEFGKRVSSIPTQTSTTKMLPPVEAVKTILAAVQACHTKTRYVMERYSRLLMNQFGKPSSLQTRLPFLLGFEASNLFFRVFQS